MHALAFVPVPGSKQALKVDGRHTQITVPGTMNRLCKIIIAVSALIVVFSTIFVVRRKRKYESSLLTSVYSRVNLVYSAIQPHVMNVPYHIFSVQSYRSFSYKILNTVV